MTTRLYGILGYPLSHSLSPVMQNAALQNRKVDGFYVPLAIEPNRIKNALKGLKTGGFSGLNLTVPYKETVLPFLDSVSPEAKEIGAVNTVVCTGKKWKGYNTDAFGFISLLNRARINPKGKHVLVLGSGGAAKAVVVALRSTAAHVTICNRTSGRANKLKSALKKSFQKKVTVAAWPPKNIECDIIVNTTSLGLSGKDKIPVGKDVWSSASASVDLIYNPAKTQFMKDAKRAGHNVAGGLDMLLFQGAKGFELWTGKKAPVKVMEKTLISALKRKK